MECREYWQRELLDCAQLASSKALHVLDTKPSLFQNYHVRPDYSSAGKAAGCGPVLRLLPYEPASADHAHTRVEGKYFFKLEAVAL